MKKVLAKGSTVAIAATSSPLAPRGFELTPELLTETVERLGYKPVVLSSVYGSTPCGFSIAPASQRADDLNGAFADDGIDAIWCSIGGSTAMQMLPLLDYDMICTHEKPFIGLSDITALLVALSDRSGIETFHGPTLRSFAEHDDESSYESFMTALSGQPFELQNPEQEPFEIIRSGDCRGPVTGGNLALISSLAGTPFQMETKGKIILIEEVGEPVYRIERMLTQLRYSGAFDGCAGVMLGEFVSCRNRYKEEYGPNELIRDWFADFDVPVIANIKTGHGKTCLTIPFGRPAVIFDGRVFFE